MPHPEDPQDKYGMPSEPTGPQQISRREALRFLKHAAGTVLVVGVGLVGIHEAYQWFFPSQKSRQSPSTPTATRPQPTEQESSLPSLSNDMTDPSLVGKKAEVTQAQYGSMQLTPEKTVEEAQQEGLQVNYVTSNDQNAKDQQQIAGIYRLNQVGQLPFTIIVPSGTQASDALRDRPDGVPFSITSFSGQHIQVDGISFEGQPTDNNRPFDSYATVLVDTLEVQ